MALISRSQTNLFTSHFGIWQHNKTKSNQLTTYCLMPTQLTPTWDWVVNELNWVVSSSQSTRHYYVLMFVFVCTSLYVVCFCKYGCVCAYACVRACVCARVCVCVHACVCVTSIPINSEWTMILVHNKNHTEILSKT